MLTHLIKLFRDPDAEMNELHSHALRANQDFDDGVDRIEFLLDMHQREELRRLVVEVSHELRRKQNWLEIAGMAHAIRKNKAKIIELLGDYNV